MPFTVYFAGNFFFSVLLYFLNYRFYFFFIQSLPYISILISFFFNFFKNIFHNFFLSAFFHPPPAAIRSSFYRHPAGKPDALVTQRQHARASTQRVRVQISERGSWKGRCILGCRTSQYSILISTMINLLFIWSIDLFIWSSMFSAFFSFWENARGDRPRKRHLL